MFFEDIANGTTMYSEHFQKLKITRKVMRSCFSSKKYIFENICVFDF